ncbi:MAG: N-acetylmuramoyl-L-alanine amidase [Candidatus Obscuribacterales bacterium]
MTYKPKLIGTRLFAMVLLMGLMVWTDADSATTRREDPSQTITDSTATTDSAAEQTPISLPPLTGKTIMLDPGHGGNDAGAIRDSIQEKDINLAVALKLKEQLEAAGATVIMTRDTDTTLALRQRVEMIGARKPDIFVSIHTNASLSSKVDGIEAYYHSADSKPLADSVYQSLVDGLSEKGNRMSRRELAVVHHQLAPAVLIEIGYLSSKHKRDLLVKDDYQTRVASAVTTGIEEYFDTV